MEHLSSYSLQINCVKDAQQGIVREGGGGGHREFDGSFAQGLVQQHRDMVRQVGCFVKPDNISDIFPSA